MRALCEIAVSGIDIEALKAALDDSLTLTYDRASDLEASAIVQKMGDSLVPEHLKQFESTVLGAYRSIDEELPVTVSVVTGRDGITPKKIRLRALNHNLDVLREFAEQVMVGLMVEEWATTGRVSIREQQSDRGVVSAKWRQGAGHFRHYIRSAAPGRLRLYMALFIVGVIAEIVATVGAVNSPTNEWIALTGRLGAPVLTASFVGILELAFSWSSLRGRRGLQWQFGSPKSNDSDQLEA